MSKKMNVRNPSEIDVGKVELGKLSEQKEVRGYKYKEIPLSYLGGEFVIVTPSIFTFGIKVDDTKYLSHSISLKISEGKRRKEFLGKLDKIVKKCQESKRMKGLLKFLFKPSTLGKTVESYNLYARVIKGCDLRDMTSGKSKRIEPKHLIGKWCEIRCVLKFRCITIGEKGSTLKVDLVGAIVRDKEVPTYDIVDELSLSDSDSSDDAEEQ